MADYYSPLVGCSKRLKAKCVHNPIHYLLMSQRDRDRLC
jgi:hypothetical protein